jgi:hypothetical protein
VTPAGLQGAIGFSAVYTSTEQTITAAGTLTLAHGLGRKPIFVQPRLKCLTAEMGYSVGDEVFTAPFSQNTSFGLSMVTDATNLTIRYGSSGLIITNKTTGGSGAITVANWSLIVSALA